jgi:hypothetical protein
MNENEPTHEINSLQDLPEPARERAQEVLSQGEEYIRENPVATVLVALALGGIIGALLFRREKEASNAHGFREWLDACPVNVGDLKKSLGKIPHDTSALRHQAKSIGKKFNLW